MNPGDVAVDVWLRGDSHATTYTLPALSADCRTWTDDDIVGLLTGMLRMMNTAKHADADPDQPIALRGFSWIVNPFESGGVVVAIEMSLGAAVAGPFDIAESDLSARIQRVMDADRLASTRPSSGLGTVH